MSEEANTASAAKSLFLSPRVLKRPVLRNAYEIAIAGIQ